MKKIIVIAFVCALVVPGRGFSAEPFTGGVEGSCGAFEYTATCVNHARPRGNTVTAATSVVTQRDGTGPGAGQGWSQVWTRTTVPYRSGRTLQYLLTVRSARAFESGGLLGEDKWGFVAESVKLRHSCGCVPEEWIAAPSPLVTTQYREGFVGDRANDRLVRRIGIPARWPAGNVLVTFVFDLHSSLGPQHNNQAAIIPEGMGVGRVGASLSATVDRVRFVR